MTTQLEPRAPRARCYLCGSTGVAAVCHHCARPICQDDRPKVLDPTGRPLSEEFTGLGIERPAAYHCTDCAHVVKGRLIRLMVAGVVIAVAGILLALLTFTAGLVVFLVGAVVAGGAWFADRRRIEQAMAARPRLPLLPSVDSVRFREILDGTLTLDDLGVYHTSVRPARGEFGVSMTFGRQDVDRLDQYRDKYKVDGPVDFCGGFVVPRGQVGVVYDGEQSGIVIRLAGNTADHPFLSETTGRTNAQWRVDSGYTLAAGRGVDFVPIWLTPSLVPESDKRNLEIEVQWTDFGPDGASLEIERIDPLTLHVPVSWGNVEGASRRLSVGEQQDPDDPGETVRTLSCNQLTLSKVEREARRLTLSVRFEQPISMDHVIRGRLSATFRGTLSGLSGVDLFGPLGGYRQGDGHQEDVRTQVNADFSLSLKGIRYQQVRVVPDQARDEGLPETTQFAGVIPDHETVIRLTNALSTEGYYVKRVIENPPRTSGRANTVNRYWDIAGRWYDGVYPVDFHLSLTGDELHDGDIRAQSGNSKVELSVQGAYASEGMERQIRNEWVRLDAITRKALTPLAAHSMPTNGSRPSKPTPADGGRSRRDEAFDALMAGKITEQTYRQIISWLDGEQ